MPVTWPPKDPDEYLDYKIKWSLRLAGDTIASSEWIVPDGIVGDQESADTTTTTIWLNGGTLGRTYSIVNRIETEGGRIMDQTARIKIKAR